MELELRFADGQAMLLTDLEDKGWAMLPPIKGIIEAARLDQQPIAPLTLPPHIQMNFVHELIKIGTRQLYGETIDLNDRPMNWLAQMLHTALHFRAESMAQSIKEAMHNQLGLTLEWRTETGRVKDMPITQQMLHLRQRMGVVNDFTPEEEQVILKENNLYC